MKTAPAASIRYAMALTFLWFGIRQLQVPEQFTGFLPEWIGGLTNSMNLTQETFVKFNGWFEIIACIFLAIGFETRIAAFLLGLHLMGIAAAVGDAIGVRDAGLAVATMALAFDEPDAWTLDHALKQKKLMANGGQMPKPMQPSR